MSKCSLFSATNMVTKPVEEAHDVTESAEEVADRCIEETVKLFKKEFQGQLEYYSTCATDGEMIKGTMSSILNSAVLSLCLFQGHNRLWYFLYLLLL